VDSETIGTRKGQKGNDVEIMQEREGLDKNKIPKA
jgi:hypothetical protein